MWQIVDGGRGGWDKKREKGYERERSEEEMLKDEMIKKGNEVQEKGDEGREKEKSTHCPSYMG